MPASAVAWGNKAVVSQFTHDTLPLALGATIDDGRDRLEAADGGVRQIARDDRGKRGAIGRRNCRRLAGEVFGNLGRKPARQPPRACARPADERRTDGR